MPDTAVAERTLPHNLEAERSVLGAVLLHNDAFNLAVEHEREPQGRARGGVGRLPEPRAGPLRPGASAMTGLRAEDSPTSPWL